MQREISEEDLARSAKAEALSRTIVESWRVYNKLCKGGTRRRRGIGKDIGEDYDGEKV